MLIINTFDFLVVFKISKLQWCVTKEIGRLLHTCMTGADEKLGKCGNLFLFRLLFFSFLKCQ